MLLNKAKPSGNTQSKMSAKEKKKWRQSINKTFQNRKDFDYNEIRKENNKKKKLQKFKMN